MAAASFRADAARPMITDDARVVDPGACQVESWVKRNRDSIEYWALPACNVTGNLELTFGGARTHDNDQGTYTSDVQAQAKTVLKRLDTNGWGAGLVGGTDRHPNLGVRDWFVYAPISVSLLDDRFVVHANLGGIREGASGQYRATWGVGSETKIFERAFLIAEVFGQDRRRASHQVGVRYWIVPNHVQLDATYGRKAGDAMADRWFTVGLRLLSPAFLGSFGR